MSKAYKIRFDFDCEGDPPRVMVVHPDGYDILEVFEEPTIRPETGVEFSWEEVDWQAGPCAISLVNLLNIGEGKQ